MSSKSVIGRWVSPSGLGLPTEQVAESDEWLGVTDAARSPRSYWWYVRASGSRQARPDAVGAVNCKIGSPQSYHPSNVRARSCPGGGAGRDRSWDRGAQGAAAGERWHPVDVSVRRVVPDFQAPEPAAAAEFYAQVLGLEVVMDLGWIVTFAAPDNPAAQISVMRQDATASVQPDVSIEVDDVDAAYAAAQRLGREILHPLTDEPWGVRRFFVRDPSGKVLNILNHP